MNPDIPAPLVILSNFISVSFRTYSQFSLLFLADIDSLSSRHTICGAALYSCLPEHKAFSPPSGRAAQASTSKTSPEAI